MNKDNRLHCRWCPWTCLLWRGPHKSGWASLANHVAYAHNADVDLGTLLFGLARDDEPDAGPAREKEGGE